MAARSGMASLISRLRADCNLGTSDYVISGGTFWQDETIQSFLDRRRYEIWREPLTAQPYYNDGGTLVYQDYFFTCRNVEEASSGTSVWQIENSSGSVVGTADYTPNYDAGHIRFNSDRGGTVYYLNARAYDYERTAADLWEAKAGHASEFFNVTTDNHTLSRKQKYDMYMDRAKSWRNRAKPRTVALIRSDY